MVAYKSIFKTVSPAITIPKEPDHYSNWFDTNTPGIYECGICGRRSVFKSDQCYKPAKAQKDA